MSSPPAERRIGRYAIYAQIASGGMATVHLGRLVGAAGFARTVAIKRLHAHLVGDPDFVSMFVDEARLAARIRHPNVVSTLDVISDGGEIFLVMDYVSGESLAHLTRLALATSQPRIPVDILLSIICGVLHGLHAAHEARDERGKSLDLVHRDVSPQNVLVGVDGLARVLDFGVAKAEGRIQTTRDGMIKGKPSYMAPEALRGGAVDRRADVFAVGVVLWEALTGLPLFGGEDNAASVLSNVLEKVVERPSAVVPDVPAFVDGAVLKALARNPTRRFPTAEHMAAALEEAVGTLPSAQAVGRWVEALAGDELTRRAALVTAIESDTRPPPSLAPGVLVADMTPAPGSRPEPAMGTATSAGRSARRRLAPFGIAIAAAIVATAWFVLRPRPASVAATPTPAAPATPSVEPGATEIESPPDLAPSSSTSAPSVSASAPRAPKHAPRSGGQLRFRSPG